jgi:GMP synthase (glutamine-hydrolysing)
MLHTKKKTCLAVRHVAFEDLGLLAPALTKRGYDLRYLEAGIDGIGGDALVAPDLVVVLGGPIAVYETDAYPFLADEIGAVAARIRAGKPILGVCLGAQLMAAALGARVAPGPVKEIGFAPLTLTERGRASVLAPLADAPVLHWHGDNCDLPAGCERLAFTPHCPVQAFMHTPAQLALQFHLETEQSRFEAWLIGHTVELAKAGIAARSLREQTQKYGAAARALGQKVLEAWLDGAAA